MSETTSANLTDWLAEAKRLFGENPLSWKFRCPVCGNEQTLADFKNIGADPEGAYQECIGRKMRYPAKNLATTPGGNGQNSPCDFAAYGLLSFGCLSVLTDTGKVVKVFPFASSDARTPAAIAKSEDRAE